MEANVASLEGGKPCLNNTYTLTEYNVINSAMADIIIIISRFFYGQTAASLTEIRGVFCELDARD